MSHEQLNNFDKTDREYSLALIDDLIRLLMSKVKDREHRSPFSNFFVCWLSVCVVRYSVVIVVCIMCWSRWFAVVIWSVDVGAYDSWSYSVSRYRRL